MLPQQYCLRWKYHHSNLQTMFSQLLDRGCFCDVTLACEGQLIRAHRVVLCACSSFFDTVLTNYASERDPIIIIKDVTFADVKCLIEFMYKGEINVEHAHLASLLKTADDLKIKGLAEVSWREEDDGPPPPIPAAEFHSPTRTHPEMYVHEQQRGSSPPMGHRGRRSASPLMAMRSQPHLPTLTPMPHSSSITINASPAEHFLGPKRKRGRPPLDDAYDVFNVRKMTHYAAHMEHQAYLEARHYAVDEQHPQLSTTCPSPSSVTAAAAAYQHHIHQQQTKQRLRQRQQQSESDEAEHDEPHPDAEWITSNLEVNVGECEQQTAADKRDEEAAEMEMKRRKAERENREMVPIKKIAKKRRERTPDEQKENVEHPTQRKAVDEQHNHLAEARAESIANKVTKTEVLNSTPVPQPVEEIEHEQQVPDHKLPAANTSPTSSSSSASSASLSSSASTTSHHKTVAHAHVPTTTVAPPPPPPPPLHRHFGKYAAPEGYMLTEHGMLMTHDFVHAPTVNVPISSGSAANAANGGDHDMVDIKMEDYDAADLRLTSEEMSQWQDVIKMDDYLAKGRRPQFWEEPFTRRVLDAIKNKRLEMKKAARILGVSYGTLYGRYREVYGCLKHPYRVKDGC